MINSKIIHLSYIYIYILHLNDKRFSLSLSNKYLRNIKIE